MFTEKEITAYRNIKAPDDLRQKITRTQRKSKKALYIMSAVAACFVILISGFALNNQSRIYINGQELKESVVFYDTASSSGRTVSSTVSVPVEIKTSGNAKVSVSRGFISINGSEASKEAIVSSSEIIWWEIEPGEAENVFEMKISDKKGVKKVTLEYENAKITVTKENEK